MVDKEKKTVRDAKAAAGEATPSAATPAGKGKVRPSASRAVLGSSAFEKVACGRPAVCRLELRLLPSTAPMKDSQRPLSGGSCLRVPYDSTASCFNPRSSFSTGSFSSTMSSMGTLNDSQPMKIDNTRDYRYREKLEDERHKHWRWPLAVLLRPVPSTAPMKDSQRPLFGGSCLRGGRWQTAPKQEVSDIADKVAPPPSLEVAIAERRRKTKAANLKLFPLALGVGRWSGSIPFAALERRLQWTVHTRHSGDG
ncbi:hypothetical protein TI39_contig280g00008 [Zymoseptoria brevis]|uniref:Uncharacterized protein n=1 Tax=Zymoseptoria brevis TaxID=1047168 RepID=A0A0F4GWT0_9PEZI|nr:hypothetical protein TI39_contig280g00008 [Zymoseptoria brevis]